MDVSTINNLEELLHLPEDTQIQSSKITRLTAAGDNYGSLMLCVNILLKTPNGTKEVNTVTKMIPPNEFIQSVFNTQVTFRNEIAFYEKIVPTLREFQKEKGVRNPINFFPEFYGGRLNLDLSNKVDKNAILMLENLKIANFVNVNRTKGFALDAAKLILQDLAELHAVPLALKLENTAIFNEKIRPFLCRFTVTDQLLAKFRGNVEELAESTKVLDEFKDRIHKGLQFNPHEPSRELFSTITHDDCWVNNTMLRFDPDGNAIENKLVDFQICDYSSCAKDVLFFLFTSVQNEVLIEFYDSLIRFYYDCFIRILNELGSDCGRFAYEMFLDELDYEAKHSQFYHITAMLIPIFAEKGSVKEISELKPEDLEFGKPSQLLTDKFVFVIKEFVKRNWI